MLMHVQEVVMKSLICTFAAVCLILTSHAVMAEKSVEGRRQVVLESNQVTVSFDVGGGSLVDFHFNDTGLNPFMWNFPEAGDKKPRPMGHFICFDRWGQPSANEEKNGMPYHGEASQVDWTVNSAPVSRNGKITATMSCRLPMGGMTLERTASLSEKSPVLEVRELITNVNKLSRVYNIVQHPSIAPPFLDENVIVDSNAWKGFMQETPMPTPEEPTIYWPQIAYKGKLVDLGRLTDDHNPAVTSFVFRDGTEYGWVTASNPAKGLLVGYIWNLKDYPWLSIWRNTADGKPAARGLEFGTTGLHQPFPQILEKMTIFGNTLCNYLDADQSVEKSYVTFLAEIPRNFKGVGEIDYSNGSIVIHERDGGTNTIRINY